MERTGKNGHFQDGTVLNISDCIKMVGKISDAFNDKGEGEHLVESKVRWDECRRLKMPQDERERKECQEFEEEEKPIGKPPMKVRQRKC